MKNQNQNITWLRAIACMMVVAIHTLNYHNFIIFDRLMHNLCFTAVPMFLMITGYLYTHNKSASGFKLLLKNGSKIFIPIIYFGTVYFIIRTILGHQLPPYYTIFWNGTIGGPIGFLYGLLPIYLLLTFIPIPKMSQAQGRLLFAVCFFVFFITEGMKANPFNVNSGYSFNMYFLYVLSGAAVRYIDIKSYTHNKILPYALFTLSIGISFMSYYSKFSFGYSSIFNYISSSCLFMFFISLPIASITKNPLGRLANNTLSFIAKYSLGIYGWHAIFIDNLHNSLLFFKNSLGVYFLFLSIFLLSLLVSVADASLWKFINTKCAPLYFRLQLFFLKKLKLFRLLNFLFQK